MLAQELASFENKFKEYFVSLFITSKDQALKQNLYKPDPLLNDYFNHQASVMNSHEQYKSVVYGLQQKSTH